MQNKLVQLGQEHLIDDIATMDEQQQGQLQQQIQQWSVELIHEQTSSWQARRLPLQFEPLTHCLESYEQPIGSQPHIGIIILAGGQGSRLGIEGPKGCFPLLGKSLFERHAEKIRLKNTPLAILTSSLNHRETVQFFEKNQMFGLPDVTFFTQKTLPLLDDHGRWFWEKSGRIADGADGNGTVFEAFWQAGGWDHFHQQGVEAVHIVPVDNPLADPFDPLFLSFHQASGADLSVKCIRMDDPEEPTGRLVRRGSQLAIAEFAELSPEQKQKNLVANTGLLLIDMHLMRHLADQTFPYHWACRAAAHWEEGQSVLKNSWKAERFIVDALGHAQKGQAICFHRDKCYAPLKEKNSIAQIEHLLNQ